jgi:hypothetical protein
MRNEFGHMHAAQYIQPGYQDAFKRLSDEQLLEQLKSMACYGDHNQTTLMLIGELYQRAQRAFGKTFMPSEKVHGDRYLYTSIYKDGVMTHYFVDDHETKLLVDGVFERTEFLYTAEGEGFEGGPRISALLDLGEVFTAIRVDENGKQVGEAVRCHFGTIAAAQGFNANPLHISKTLPLGIFEINFKSPAGLMRQTLNEALLKAAETVTTDPEKLTRIQEFVNQFDLLEEYRISVEKVFNGSEMAGGMNLIPITTQIHVFPAGTGAPVKFLTAMYGETVPGFVDRNKYPALFLNPEPNANHYAPGAGGFGGPGGPGTPIW